MRNKLTIAVVGFLLSFFILNKGYATHTYGGELLYTHLSGNTYQLKLTIYGDCAGQAYPTLINAKPIIFIYNNTVSIDTIQMKLDSLNIKEVTPVCAEQANKTTCKGGNIPGITQYDYYVEYTLPTTSSNWRFVFNGNMTSTSAGRTNAITNLSNVGIMHLVASLNNINGQNSSPRYTSVPTPFFCTHKHQEYNQGAIDDNNDSLHFSLTAALVSPVAPALYRTGYSATKPLSVIDSTFNFNSENGQLSFTPDIAQTSVVVNKVEEYINGVLVGTSMREMTCIVFNDCYNTPPEGKINKNIKGAGFDNNTVYVCLGTEFISFDIDASDTDGDSVSITTNSAPSGASVSIKDNNTRKPVVNLYWNTKNQALGTYYLYLNLKDDGCPLSSSQTIAYTIKIVPPFSISHEVLYPTNCYHKQYIQFNISNGIEKKTLSILKGNAIIATHTDTSGAPYIRDSVAKGTYIARVFSPYLQCSVDYPFEVADSGTYPIPPYLRPESLCIGDPIVVIPDYTHDGNPITWFREDGSPAHPTEEYNTNTAHTYRWFMTQKVSVCESVKGDFKVIVNDNPIVKALTTGGQKCLGDTVELIATGAATYQWLPTYRVKHKGDIAYTRVMEPDVYIVIGKSYEGCINTDTVLISGLEDCCTFSYPTAFTPNGDGINDGYKPIMYGNEGEYLFAVYNRWGQRVFITSNPRQYWDGTFNSQKCDVGVYFYKFRATCLTGHSEVKAGEFMLVR
ncbi:MAG: gliding motility-associated C-terminal domain-containing protein [Flavipsychrobacter sp.]|nr:gliding motility-associated C-terminal domain-containing protein [Flavipsychrobacter sp.]